MNERYQDQVEYGSIQIDLGRVSSPWGYIYYKPIDHFNLQVRINILNIQVILGFTFK